MKLVMSAAVLFACATSLHGQITTKLIVEPGRPHELIVRNDSSAPLVAYIVSARQMQRSANNIDAPFVVFLDPLVDPAVKPLPAGEQLMIESRGVTIGSVQRFFEGPVSAAGILADGTTSGDPALVSRLLLRRSNMLQAIELAIDTLIDAGNRNVPRSQMLNQFKRLADSAARWYLPVEQQVGRALYNSIISKLSALPEGEIGTAFPPSAFIAEEIAALHQRRVALLQSRPSLSDAPFLTK